MKIRSTNFKFQSQLFDTGCKVTVPVAQHIKLINAINTISTQIMSMTFHSLFKPDICLVLVGRMMIISNRKSLAITIAH